MQGAPSIIGSVELNEPNYYPRKYLPID